MFIPRLFSCRFWLVLAGGILALLATPRAHAHQNGIAAEGCIGCHSGGVAATVGITSMPAVLLPGQMATFSVAIATPEGYAGLFMEVDAGTLVSLPGQGTQLISGGITHTAPKRATNGVATFQVGWMAPAAPGGVLLDVYALAANGDGTPRGDGGGMGSASYAFGCSGLIFYRDFDGDGYGSMQSGTKTGCGMPEGYSLNGGDCDDNNNRIHPGAPEVCNHLDDNCNTLIDENLPLMTYYLQPGGGASPGAPPTVTDCAPPRGYCERASCGTGWCRRLASSCDGNDCTPGEPRPETCNAFDDDCDGVIDNGTDLQLCGSTGLTCMNGVCVKPGAVVPDAGALDAGNKDTNSRGGPGPAPSGVGQVTGMGGGGTAQSFESGGCKVAAQTPRSSPAIGLAFLSVSLAAAFGVRKRRRRVRARL